MAELGLALVGVTEAGADAAVRDLLAVRRASGLVAPFASWEPEMRADPRRFWPEARTIISVAVAYPRVTEDPPPGLYGLVARSLRGPDYHRVVKERLSALAERLRRVLSRPFRWQAWVDSVPAVERFLAWRAGLGFFGKNCCLISPSLGSWFWLGELVLDVEPEDLSVPPPAFASEVSECGSCGRCLAACPTGALVSPYVLDPSRCLSYLTQAKGPLPKEYRALLGRRLFGCDTCQEVCPYNRGVSEPGDRSAFPGAWLPLEPLLFRGREFLAGTALAWRGVSVVARNAAVVLGNLGEPGSVPLLESVLRHPSVLVRSHAAWALGRVGTRRARAVLARAVYQEPDPSVKQEIEEALASF